MNLSLIGALFVSGSPLGCIMLGGAGHVRLREKMRESPAAPAHDRRDRVGVRVVPAALFSESRATSYVYTIIGPGVC